MNHFRILILFFVSFAVTLSLSAQPLHWMGQKRPYKWQFGLGWNAVEDDGRGFCQPFDVEQSWNVPVFPSRVMVDRYLKYGLSVEFSGAYNNYQEGKLINDSTNLSGLFISADFNCKFSFYQLLQIQWFDPYVSLGAGGTHRDAYANPFIITANASAGVNFWVYRNWGIQLQAGGKYGIAGDLSLTQGNYMQYTAGVVYKLTDRRGRSAFSKKQYRWTKSRPRYRGKRSA
jgi:hypothetical protein